MLMEWNIIVHGDNVRWTLYVFSGASKNLTSEWIVSLMSDFQSLKFNHAFIVLLFKRFKMYVIGIC